MSKLSTMYAQQQRPAGAKTGTYARDLGIVLAIEKIEDNTLTGVILEGDASLGAKGAPVTVEVNERIIDNLKKGGVFPKNPGNAAVMLNGVQVKTDGFGLQARHGFAVGRSSTTGEAYDWAVGYFEPPKFSVKMPDGNYRNAVIGSAADLSHMSDFLDHGADKISLPMIMPDQAKVVTNLDEFKATIKAFGETGHNAVITRAIMTDKSEALANCGRSRGFIKTYAGEQGINDSVERLAGRQIVRGLDNEALFAAVQSGDVTCEVIPVHEFELGKDSLATMNKALTESIQAAVHNANLQQNGGERKKLSAAIVQMMNNHRVGNEQHELIGKLGVVFNTTESGAKTIIKQQVLLDSAARTARTLSTPNITITDDEAATIEAAYRAMRDSAKDDDAQQAAGEPAAESGDESFAGLPADEEAGALSPQP